MFQVKRKERVVKQVRVNIICVQLQNIKGGGVAGCWEEGIGSCFQSFLLLEVLAFAERDSLPTFL